MNGVTCRHGDVQSAVGVMLEAAEWLKERGMPLWTRQEIQALPQKHPADAFLTLYINEQPAAAALLIGSDPLFWPDVPEGSSGFLHKLSVRRAYAGQGLAMRLIEYAAQICKRNGMQALRLDCDATREKLKTLYLTAGFTYIGQRQARTKTHGMVTAALFARALR